ncbi:hypothetical protein N7476_004887 [Penicillium atrosanguineum]|uniref:GPI anchored protein n=1 Tax=Penicillium atrosanguineum TaxID=1132637 RepID=A0A9W9PYV1_9EURO|nr:hypothetical protein N7526_001811 [Penicillium atrosanguineum]KAJ5318467.1 hypothetical protein N7476_004887 [Penicillium atrosanguineum]
MQFRFTILIAAYTVLAASQTTSDSFNDVPAPTNVGCGGTVELDSTTIIGTCSGSTSMTTSTTTVQQSGNGGIVDGTTTIGGNAVTTSSQSTGGGPRITGWNAAVVALGGAGAMLAI